MHRELRTIEVQLVNYGLNGGPTLEEWHATLTAMRAATLGAAAGRRDAAVKSTMRLSATAQAKPAVETRARRRRARQRLQTLARMDEAHLRTMFENADANGDGAISVRELMVALRYDPTLAALLHLPSHIHQEDETRAAFEKVFALLDDDHTREITWKQFLRHIMDWTDAPPSAAGGGEMEGGGDWTDAPPSAVGGGERNGEETLRSAAPSGVPPSPARGASIVTFADDARRVVAGHET